MMGRLTWYSYSLAPDSIGLCHTVSFMPFLLPREWYFDRCSWSESLILTEIGYRDIIPRRESLAPVS